MKTTQGALCFIRRGQGVNYVACFLMYIDLFVVFFIQVWLGFSFAGVPHSAKQQLWQFLGHKDCHAHPTHRFPKINQYSFKHACISQFANTLETLLAHICQQRREGRDNYRGTTVFKKLYFTTREPQNLVRMHFGHLPTGIKWRYIQIALSLTSRQCPATNVFVPVGGIFPLHALTEAEK